MAETLKLPEAKAPVTEAKPTLVPVQILRGYWPAGPIEGYSYPEPDIHSLPPGTICKISEDEAQRLFDIDPPVAKGMTEKAYQAAKAAK